MQIYFSLAFPSCKYLFLSGSHRIAGVLFTLCHSVPPHRISDGATGSIEVTSSLLEVYSLLKRHWPYFEFSIPVEMQNMALILLVFLFYCGTASGSADTLWPIPQRISGTGGPFPVSPAFGILSSSKSDVLERGITRYLEIITREISLPDQANEVTFNSGESLELLLVNVASDNENLSLETSYQYNLSVTAGKAQIDAASPYGAL